MSTSTRSTHRPSALVATVVYVAFFWTLLLSVSPQLHARIHSDGNRTGHTCAVTLIATGSYDHGAPSPLVSAPCAGLQFSKVPALTPQWVESPFLGASILEHAPPALV